MKSLIAIFVFCSSLAIAAPELPDYESGQYYVFENVVLATAALKYINEDSGIFPVIPHNALTGEPQPDKTSVICWCDELIFRSDGKPMIPRIPTKLLVDQNVSIDDITSFFTLYRPTVEKYEKWWFQNE